MIEVFASPADATDRSTYIQSARKSMSIVGTEYDYLNGPVLVRITGRVKPSAAKAFQSAVSAVTAT